MILPFLLCSHFLFLQLFLAELGWQIAMIAAYCSIGIAFCLRSNSKQFGRRIKIVHSDAVALAAQSIDET